MESAANSSKAGVLIDLYPEGVTCVLRSSQTTKSTFGVFAGDLVFCCLRIFLRSSRFCSLLISRGFLLSVELLAGVTEVFLVPAD